MLVSIIINNYNYAVFLGTAIESALGQTYPRVEVIVVDDGSQDHSRAVIESFGDRVTAIFKANGGQASAFNAGFDASRGELVLFLDSDDLLEPHAISNVVCHWRQGVSKVHFPLQAIDQHGHSLGALFPKHPLASGDVLPALLTEGDYCSPPTTGNVFTRDYLAAVLPMPEAEWPDCADVYIVQVAPFFGAIGAIREPLGKYRVHGNSLTANTDGDKLRVENLRRRLRADERKQRLLDRFSQTRGLKMNPNAVFDTYSHYKARLASLKLSPRDHPFQEDRLLSLGRKLIAQVWQTASLRTITKVAFTCWAAAVVVLPVPIAEYLILGAFSRYSRSGLREALVRPKLLSADLPLQSARD